MPQTVVDIISISSGEGWFFGYASDELDELEPIAAFAAVRVEENGTDEGMVRIIPISLAMMYTDGIVGEVIDEDRPIVHRTKLTSAT